MQLILEINTTIYICYSILNASHSKETELFSFVQNDSDV